MGAGWGWGLLVCWFIGWLVGWFSLLVVLVCQLVGLFCWLVWFVGWLVGLCGLEMLCGLDFFALVGLVCVLLVFCLCFVCGWLRKSTCLIFV